MWIFELDKVPYSCFETRTINPITYGIFFPWVLRGILGCFWPVSLHPPGSTYMRASQKNQGSSFKNVDLRADQSSGLKAEKRSKIVIMCFGNILCDINYKKTTDCEYLTNQQLKPISNLMSYDENWAIGKKEIKRRSEFSLKLGNI